MVLDGTIFMIVVSRTSATYDRLIPCDPSSTRNTKSILLNFNYFKYTIYFFIWVDDKWKDQISEY